MNPKIFKPNNDTRMSLYIGCDKKTIYNMKSGRPEVYKALKKGWIIKCANHDLTVDDRMVELLEIEPRWYELLMLGYMER